MRRSSTRIVIEGRAAAAVIPISPVDGATTARAGVALLAATRATATMAIHGKTFCMSSPSE